jgi:hypothetical protein
MAKPAKVLTDFLVGLGNVLGPSQSNPDRQGRRPRKSILNGQEFVGACTAGSDGYKQVRLYVDITLHMIIYPHYMGLVQDILILTLWS